MFNKTKAKIENAKETANRVKDAFQSYGEKEQLTYPDYLPPGTKLAFEKSYGVYGTQYNSWINEKVTRESVLAKVKDGDTVDFRLVPWGDGHMYLIIHHKTGLDFAVLPNNVTHKIRFEYYGCYLTGEVDNANAPSVHLKVWQAPEWWE